MLLAEIVFASRLLGLAAGEQHVAVQVDAEVRKVEVRRNGQRVAVMQQPPWTTVVDLGPELVPQELTVIAFDGEGRERGRDTQAINVSHPPAELGILLERESERVTAKVTWSHFAHEKPKSVEVKLDGKTIARGRPKSTFALGVVDASKIHVLGVEATFPAGVRSRREIVFGGGYSEQLPAELTPVVLRQRQTTSGPATCLRAGDKLLPSATVEQGSGAALFVLNGSRGSQKYDTPDHRQGGLFRIRDAEIRIVHPVAKLVEHPGGSTRLFDSLVINGVNGTQRLMAIARTPYGVARIADAVASAAVRALRGQRRVVVLVIGLNPAVDHSLNSPPVVRRYLERVGVPLRVWSLTGPRPDLADTWGEVRDVSTTGGLLQATEELRQELDSQRVAWLPVTPLEAFQITATPDCAYAPLAMSPLPASRGEG